MQIHEILNGVESCLNGKFLRLIISVPLKNSDSYYTFYTLQFRVAELNKYVQMTAESPYLVLDDSK
jgi:hypothetical protein